MPRGIKLLRHQKYAKMLRQSSNGPFAQADAHQKNSGTLFCVGMWLMSVCGNFETQNSLRLRFGSAGFADPAPVFLIQLAPGIDRRASVRLWDYEKQLAKCLKYV